MHAGVELSKTSV